jgi:hypothetical protein
MRKVVRRIGVLSIGKIAGLLYASLGLIIGAFVALASTVGGLAGLAQGEGSGFLGMFLGVGAIVLFPCFYGLVGALMGMLMSALYNLVAGMIGGVELEVDG